MRKKLHLDCCKNNAMKDAKMHRALSPWRGEALIGSGAVLEKKVYK